MNGSGLVRPIFPGLIALRVRNGPQDELVAPILGLDHAA
jgi:hypothetical protein